MTEQVGTTKTFDLPVDEIIEIALEGIGGEFISHKEAKFARTALNLIFIDLQNRGMAPLASLELTSVALTSGSSEGYSLGTDSFSLLDAVITVSNTSTDIKDLTLQKISHGDWLAISDKTVTGRPTQYFVDRQRDAPLVTFWPVPDSNKYSFKGWTLKKIADVNASYELVDLPTRYLPAIIKGLRFYMSDFRQSPLDERMYLKQEYLETLENALSEDRQRVDFVIYPHYRGQLGS